MNQSHFVKSLVSEISTTVSHMSDDFLDDDESRDKLLDYSRKLVVAAEKPGNVAFQTGLLVSCLLALLQFNKKT